MIYKKDLKCIKKTKDLQKAQLMVLNLLQKGTKTHFSKEYKDFEGNEIFEKIKSYEQDDGTYILLRYEGEVSFMEKINTFTIAYFEHEPKTPNNPFFPITLGIIKEAKEVITFIN